MGLANDYCILLFESLRAQPFEPFRIHFSDGSFHDIKHPEMVKVEKMKAHVFFHEKDEPYELVLRNVAVSLLHINRVEPLVQPIGNCEAIGAA